VKIYYSNFGAVKDDENLFPKIDILVSYYGLKKLTAPKFCNHLFLDSGAFSAFTKKIEINLNEYIIFIKENKSELKVYASLDDISSYKKSIVNFKKMLKEKINPLPAFHIGEPLDVLDFYFDHTDYVALGGIAKQPKRERIPFLDKTFSRYPNSKFHGFGITDKNILKKYPWYSVDSSSIHMQARYGGISTPWGWTKINPDVNQKDLSWAIPLKIEIVKEWVESLKFKKEIKNIFELARQNDTEGTYFRCLISVVYYELLKKECTKNKPIHKPKKELI